MAVAHFVDGNFREAAHRFHQLKRANYTGVSPQNRYAVELLELICLFEVSSSVNQSEEEPTDLKYIWKKANGLFEQWMDDSHVYRKALTHFYTVAFSNLTEQKHSLKQWKSDIEKYKDNKEYRGIDEQLTWIESRLTRLPIRKVFFAYV